MGYTSDHTLHDFSATHSKEVEYACTYVHMYCPHGLWYLCEDPNIVVVHCEGLPVEPELFLTTVSREQAAAGKP